MSELTTRVGVLGLGAIGMPIAQRLVDAGFEVAAHDAEPTRTAALAGRASASVSTGSDALLACPVLCVVTPDEAALVELAGPGGIGLRASAVRTVLLHSTVLPERARALAADFAHSGVTIVEAPVSGGPGRAREGALTVLLGCDGDAEPARPVLDALAGRVFQLGGVGSASAVKLANQLVLFAAIGALHEGLALAHAYGIEERAVLDVLSASTGDTWAGRNFDFFDGLARTYDANGTAGALRPWRKDLDEVVEAAAAANLAAPLAQQLAPIVGARIEAHARPQAVTKGDLA